jgi:predicted SpoU family rRNA methylase
MEKINLPIALVIALAAQLAGGVWWVSQQASTITSLEDTVSQLGSRMAIEDNINLKRDVQSNKDDLIDVYDGIDDLYEELDNLTRNLMVVTELQRRIAVMEATQSFIKADHGSMKKPPKPRPLK